MDKIWIKNYDNGFPVSMNYPDKTMYELFKETVGQYPGYTACSFLGTDIAFSQLLSLVDRVAANLNETGIRKGDVVTICLPNTPHAVAVFYALNKLGAIANMVHPLTPSDELSEIIQKTRSVCLFVLNAFYPKYKDMLPKTGNRHTIVCAITDYLSLVKKFGFYVTKGRKIKKVETDSMTITWNDLLAGSKSAIGEYERVIQPKECAVYLHSGGTMGIPKTIMLSSYNFNVLALQGPYIIGIAKPAGYSIASILPVFHGFGLCMGMHTMMVSGITAILVPVFSADSLVSLLCKEKPNFIAAVPTLLEGIMNNKKIADQDLSYIKAVFCGGDTLTRELKMRFDKFLEEHKCNARVREGYGLTETVTVCSVNPINNNRADSIGVPLADILMKIVEPGSEKEMPAGESGEICVAGPTVMLGYLDDPQATKEAIHLHEDGLSWVHTGDYGFMDEDGFFHYTQRIKRIIKVSGIPVFPSQIEDVIAHIPGIKEVGVIGIAHPYKMQVVKAFVVLDDPAMTQDYMRKHILEICAEKLIKHAIPAQIVFMEKLPRTKVGKVDTLQLEKDPSSE
ncbi:MAG: class I adenylate-forming enzyme family protein [Saccharofermentanales bacterium]